MTVAVTLLWGGWDWVEAADLVSSRGENAQEAPGRGGACMQVGTQAARRPPALSLARR